jgi:hypothetical protein
MLPNYPLLPPYLTLTSLPGPSRKRTISPYCYRLSYRNPDPAAPGCALLWEVYGGRLTYQVALERKPSGKVEWHCTCADAVYRGETVPNHVCKHVRGLVAQGRPADPPAKQAVENAATSSP